jgi:hypothetical protein
MAIGLFGLYFAVSRSSFFSFILLTSLFASFFCISTSLAWAVFIRYKPVVYLGSLIAAHILCLTYFTMVAAAVARSLFFKCQWHESRLGKAYGWILRHCHMTSFFSGLFICLFFFLGLYHFSKPKIFHYTYTGELLAIDVDYFSLAAPASAVLERPKISRVIFADGDIFLAEEPLSPTSAQLRDVIRIFFANPSTNRSIQPRGSPMNMGFHLFPENLGSKGPLTLELAFRDHTVFFTNYSYRAKNDRQGGAPGPAGAKALQNGRQANSRILWFISSAQKILEFYRFEPNYLAGSKGNYRTRHGVILTKELPPFSIKSSEVSLSFPGGGVLRICSGENFAPVRAQGPQLPARLTSALHGIVFGWRQQSLISPFAASGAVGHEEISIQAPIAGNARDITLRTYATANFINGAGGSRNITLSLAATAETKEELALLLSVWRIVSKTLEFHKTQAPPDGGFISMKGPSQNTRHAGTGQDAQNSLDFEPHK